MVFNENSIRHINYPDVLFWREYSRIDAGDKVRTEWLFANLYMRTLKFNNKLGL